MSLELISDDVVVKKGRRKVESAGTGIIVTKKPVSAESVESVESVKSEEQEEIVKEKMEVPKMTVGMIVKRLYFPEDTYSKKEIQAAFKKILADHGLVWIKAMMKSYARNDGTAILTGMYASNDGNKKVFCVYEGMNKPMTAIIKIMGTGGMLVIDLNSFSHKVGCTIEDKDEKYVANVLLALQERSEVYKEKKMETKTLEDIQIDQDKKIEKEVNDSVEKWIEAHRFYYDNYCECLLWKRGIYNIENIRKFRKMEIENTVRLLMRDGEDREDIYGDIRDGEKGSGSVF